jgi:NTE family protein
MPRIGIVCGSGGDVGVAFMSGCVTAIHEATGWDPSSADYVVGTSGGSLIAATLRAQIPPEDFHATMVGTKRTPVGTAKLTAAVMGSAKDNLPPLAQDALTHARLTGPELLQRSAIRPHQIRPIALAAAALPEGPLDTQFVHNKVNLLIGEAWPDAPMLITATRMDNGHRIVFTGHSRVRTTLPTAVAASCAIPSIFKPVEIDGARYVDGGLHSSTNADVLLGHELDAVIILSPLSSNRMISRSLAGPVRSMMRVVAVREQERLERAGALVMTIHPDRESISAMGLNLMDVSKRPRVSEAGRNAAFDALRSERAAPMRELLWDASD